MSTLTRKESVLSAKSQVNIKYNYLSGHGHANDGHEVLIQRSYNNQGPIYKPIITRTLKTKKEMNQKPIHTTYQTIFLDPQG